MPNKTKYKEDPYVLCPFYRKETPIQVKCAGICGTHTINDFNSSKDKQFYKDDFCCGYYWNCPLYIALVEDGKE